MKQILARHAKDLLLLALIAFLGWQWLRPNSGPKVGSAAVTFDLPLVSGTGRFRLADQRGHPVLLEVFASWCGTCQQSTPVLNRAWQKYRDQGIRFVAVSIDENPGAARRAAEAWRIPYDVAVDDGTVARAYAIRAVPTLVVLDREGKVRRVEAGMPSASDIDGWFKDL